MKPGLEHSTAEGMIAYLQSLEFGPFLRELPHRSGSVQPKPGRKEAVRPASTRSVIGGDPNAACSPV